MIDWVLGLFRQTAAEVLFFSICLAGAVISAFSLVFGGHGDADSGDGDSGDGDHAEQGDHGIGFASLFSVRGVSLLATGFGGVGYLVYHRTQKPLLASVAGIIGAFALAIPGLWFIHMFFQQQASSLVSSDHLEGKQGSVVLSIPGAGAGRGEVSLVVSGTPMVKPAVTNDPETIKKGSMVRVVRSSAEVVEVTRV